MAVYVDAPLYSYGRMVMCHMIADTPEELHAMADRIGVARRWFQRHASFPHYDVCKTKRGLAVAAGAIEVDRTALVTAIRPQVPRWPGCRCSSVGKGGCYCYEDDGQVTHRGVHREGFDHGVYRGGEFAAA